jgi:hypothetical protein
VSLSISGTGEKLTGRINDVLHPPADDSLDQFLRTLVDYNGLEELWV